MNTPSDEEFTEFEPIENKNMMNAPSDDAFTEFEPLARAQGESPIPLTSKQEASAKGEIGINELAATDYAAATGVEFDETEGSWNPLSGKFWNAIGRQISNMGLSVGGRLNANLQTQAAQQLLDSDGLSDKDVDDLMDKMAYGALGYVKPVKNGTMAEWDENEGSRIKNHGDRIKARNEFAKQIALEFLKERSAAKQNAQTELENRDITHKANVVTRGLAQVGYSLPYFLRTPGIAAQFLEEGTANAVGNANDEYAYDDGGNFVKSSEGDSAGRAAFKGFGSAGIETATEVVGGKVGGAVLKRGGKIVGEAIGKTVGRFPIAKEVGDAVKSVVPTAVGKAAGKFTKSMGNLFNWTSRKLHLENPVEENIEEWESSVANALFGFDTRDSEVTEESTSWNRFVKANKDFFSPSALLELNEAMALTMGGGAFASRLAQRGRIRDVDNFLREHEMMSEDDIANTSLEVKAQAIDAWANRLSRDQVIEKVNKARGWADKLADKIAGESGNLATEVADVKEQIEKEFDRQMGKELADINVPEQKFNIPIENGRIKFEEIPVPQADGTTVPMRGVRDTAGSGVCVVEDTRGKTSKWITIAPDGGAHESESLGSAITWATRAKNFMALNDAKDAMKEQFIGEIVAKDYAGAKDAENENAAQIEQVRTIDEAVRLSEQYGVNISANANFNENRKGWRLPNGVVILVRDNINSPLEASRLLRHEVVGHSGTMMQPEFLEADGMIGELRDENMSRLLAEGPIDDNTANRAKRESVANTIQQRRHHASVEDKVEHAARDFARKVGLKLKMNDADAEVVAENVEKSMRNGTFDPPAFENDLNTPITTENKETKDEAGNVPDEEQAQPEPPAQGGQEAAEEGSPAEVAPQAHENVSTSESGTPDAQSTAPTSEGKEAAPEAPSDVRKDFDERISAMRPDDIRELIIANATDEEVKALVDTYEKAFNSMEDKDYDAYYAKESEIVKAIKEREAKARRAAMPRKQASADEVIAQAKVPFNDAERVALEKAADVEGLEASDESPTDTSFLGTLSAEAPIVRLNPANVDRSDAVLPNMKKDANRTTGITKPLEGEYHPTMAGIGAAWLTKDGKIVVITGRHRSELAQRKGRSMLYYLYREADGFTKEMAQIYDAVANIHDEKGNINDYLGFLDHVKPTREQAEKAGILYGKGLTAWSLYADATEAVRSATALDGSPKEGQITPAQATTIAQAAPKNANPRNAFIQSALLRTAKSTRMGADAFVGYCREMTRQLQSGKVNKNLLEGQQMDLFQDEEFLAMEALAIARNKYRQNKADGYSQVATNLRAALNRSGKLELTDEYAKDLGVTDKTDKKQLEKAYETALERADYWDPSGTRILSDADTKVMDAAINVKADATAAKNKALKERIKAKIQAKKEGKPLPKEEKKPEAKKPESKPEAPKNETANADGTKFTIDGAKFTVKNGIIIQEGMTKSERDFLRREVESKSTEYLENALNDRSQLSEFKELAREELAKRKGAKLEPPATPKQTRKRTVVMKNAEDDKALDDALNDFYSPELDGKTREKQTALSGGTSRNQNPAGNEYGKKWHIFKPGTRNVDIGAGRFDKATKFLADIGVTNLPFDPVNRTRAENESAANAVRENPADTATVHNVLNVIDNDKVMDGIVNQAARAIKKDGWAIFTVYEGNRSGKATPTRDGYQRNAKASAYVPSIQKYFGDVQAHGNVITARKPKDVGPAFWAYDSSFEDGVDFMSEEFDPEVFSRRCTAAAKVVKILNKDGKGTFENLCRVLAERKPEKYEELRPYLRGVWNAVAEQLDAPEVSKDEAKRIYGIIDANNLKENTNEDDGRGVRGEVSGGEPAARGDSHDGVAGDESAAGARGEPEGLLAGGSVRAGNPDGRVDDIGSRDVPGLGEGLADRGAAEVPSREGDARNETSGRMESVPDQGVPAGGERETGRDRGENGNRSRVEKAADKAAEETKVAPKRTDFVMTKAVEDAILEPNKTKRIKNNITALRLLKQLAERNYEATPEEQETLAKFVGWGGLSQVFDRNYEVAYSAEQRGDADGAAFYVQRSTMKQGGYDLFKEIRELLTDEELASAKNSAITAFYTPIEMVRAEHAALRAIGLNGGRFLGPSAGVGNYVSAAGAYDRAVNWQLVEKDKITGGILKALFPNQRVSIMGYEETKFPDGFFDLAIDNVPYADIPLRDKKVSPKSMMIHDFFFAKTLAKLRPGGIMMFLTDKGTLDKSSAVLRNFLTEHGGKIVGAVRLPNGFFSDNANTQAAADLVIVQRIDGMADNSAFNGIHEFSKGYKYVRGKGNVEVPIGYNKYFADHPEQVIGKLEVGSSQYGPALKITMPEGTKEQMFADIRDAIDRALANADRDALLKSVPIPDKPASTPIYDKEGLRQGNIAYKDGLLYIKSGDNLEPLAMPTGKALNKELTKRYRNKGKIVEGVVKLRTALRAVVDAEMNNCTDEELKPLLSKLNSEYDTFKAKQGGLHDKYIMPFVLLDRADGNRILALERVNKDGTTSKADIFTKRVISRGEKASKADTPRDALIICYSENGVIVPERVGELLGVSADEAVKKLKDGGDAFENPQNGKIEPSWEYLSGHVRTKLAAARAAVEAGDESFRKNCEALEKVLPPMVRLEDVEIKFGASWEDVESMKDFLREAFGVAHHNFGLRKSELTGAWDVNLNGHFSENPWGTTSFDTEEFIERVLNHGNLESWHSDPVTKTRWRDEAETEANKLAAEKLHRAYAQFLRENDKWAESSYLRYNDVNNDNVPISMPENIMPFKSAGMSDSAMRMLFEDGDPAKPKKGREYQSHVIARGVLGGSSLCLAHCVGAGKTLEMQSIGMLGRHLGMFKKSMYVVPNHMLDQFCNEFIEAFPNANILKMTSEDVKPENRRAFFAQVANGDWDAIVVKHSTFSQKLGMSREYQTEYANRQLADLERMIDELNESGDRITLKKAEKMKAKKEQEIEKLQNSEAKDNEIVPFEELGVDQLFVDEAHNFKGLPIMTRQGRTGGLSSGDSQRAVDMEMKTEYVQSLHGGDRGVVFATGTPLSNAPAVESYVFLRYLAPKLLKEQGLWQFDDFIDTFGRITTETEFCEDGKTTKEKDKISAFVNIPELMRLFKSRVDIVNADQLDIKRPTPKYEMIDIDMTPTQEAIMERISEEAPIPGGKNWRSKNMDMTWVAKYACLTPRLLGFQDGGNKILRVVNEVKKVYDETSDNKGAQLIFLDRFKVGYQMATRRILKDRNVGAIDDNSKFDLNEEIKQLLIQRGIPESEIAIVQDLDKKPGDKDQHKEELFAKVRNGEVRVLIGSRPRMGEGTNVQKRLAAIHLLHPGWKPAEDEQAIGRIIRFGNDYDIGRVFYYLTKGNSKVGSYETKNHQLIGVKSELIKQIMHGNDTIRTVEMDESEMDRDMLMGLASGNKALLELIGVRKQARKLELNTESTFTSARRMKDKSEINSREAERKRAEWENVKQGIEKWRKANEGKDFALALPDGTTLEKTTDIAEHISKEVINGLTMDAWERYRKGSWPIGSINGVDLILAWNDSTSKFSIAVKELGVAREINNTGFVPDFTPQAFAAFKGQIARATDPGYVEQNERSLDDYENMAKKQAQDAERLQKEAEELGKQLKEINTRRERLEREVEPLIVKTTQRHGVSTYGNWVIRRSPSEAVYEAQQMDTGATLRGATVKALLPKIDEYDFANPKDAVRKTKDVPTQYLNQTGDGGLEHTFAVKTEDVDFFSQEFDRKIEWEFAVNGLSGREVHRTMASGLLAAKRNVKFQYVFPNGNPGRSPNFKEKHQLSQCGVSLLRVGHARLKNGIMLNTENEEKRTHDWLERHFNRDGSVRTSHETPAVARPNARGSADMGERDAGGSANNNEMVGRAQGSGRVGSAWHVDSGADSGRVAISQMTFSDLGADFDSPELSTEAEAYVTSEDKTPTEEVSRNVFGMTNDDIATEMRALNLQPPSGERKSDDVLAQQVETLLSRRSYMEKLAHAVRQFKRPVKDYEIVALGEYFYMCKDELEDRQSIMDDLLLIPKDERDEETVKLLDEAREDLKVALARVHEAGLAKMGAASEQGRGLRANRMTFAMGQNDYSLAGIVNSIGKNFGSVDKIPPEMLAQAKELADEFKNLDEEQRASYTARLKAFSEKVIADLKSNGKRNKATERKIGDEEKRVMRNYLDAMAQIEVHADEAGGTLLGPGDQMYPSWGRWLKHIGEYHCFNNPNITEEEVMNAIVKDVSKFLVGVDANQVRDAITGFGHNFRQSRYDSQRLMNDLRSQARAKRQLDYMNEKNQLPPATGMVRDDPSLDLRKLNREVQERKKEVDETSGGQNRLKGALQSAKTRLRNRIEDLEEAIATGEKIERSMRTPVEDDELRKLRERRDELQRAYDEMFKTERGLTDEQRVKTLEKSLSRELERTLEDLARAKAGDFSPRAKRSRVNSATADALRQKIEDVKNSILELKSAAYEFGLTPEEIAKKHAQKFRAREAAILRAAERIEKGDLRKDVKPQPPMPKEDQKRYDEMGRQLKKAHQKLAAMRLAAEESTAPSFWRKGKEWLKFVSAAQRAVKATLDFSAVLRQAARISLGHPTMAVRGFGKAWKSMANEVSLQAVNDEIMSDESVQEAVEKYGLHLREVDAISNRDVEMFHGMESSTINFFGKKVALVDIPFLGELMLKSERHYITYLNVVSAELYSAIVNDTNRFPGGATPWQKKMLCDMINIWNGSGALSKDRRQAMQKSGLNEVFWAPGLALSRIQSTIGYDMWHPLTAKGIQAADKTFTPVSIDERKTMAKLGLREHVKSSLAMLALGALLRSVLGDDDEKDRWDNSDWFEKLLMLASPTIGSTTNDLTGGERSIYRLLHDVIKGEKRSSTGRTQKLGEKFGSPTVTQMLFRFTEGKLSPWASELLAFLNGKDYVGEASTLKKSIIESIVPLTFTDLYDQVTETGVGKSLVTIPLTLFGAGGSTYDRKPYENAVNPFEEALKEYREIENDENLDEETRAEILANIRESNPLMRDDVRDALADDLRQIRNSERQAKKSEKVYGEADEWLAPQIERDKKELLNAIREAKRR